MYIRNMYKYHCKYMYSANTHTVPVQVPISVLVLVPISVLVLIPALVPISVLVPIPALVPISVHIQYRKTNKNWFDSRKKMKNLLDAF